MCLAYQSYVSCIACFTTPVLTQGLSCHPVIQCGHQHHWENSDPRSVGINPNVYDRVLGSKRLKLATSELMKFGKIEGGQVCWTYPGNCLMPLPNVEHNILLNWANLSFSPAIRRWFNLVLLLYTYEPLVLPNFLPLTILMMCMLRCGSSKKSHRPFRLIRRLSMSFSMTLFTSSMMSSNG